MLPVIQSSKFSRYNQDKLDAPTFANLCPAIKFARCWQLAIY